MDLPTVHSSLHPLIAHPARLLQLLDIQSQSYWSLLGEGVAPTAALASQAVADFKAGKLGPGKVIGEEEEEEDEEDDEATGAETKEEAKEEAKVVEEAKEAA